MAFTDHLCDNSGANLFLLRFVVEEEQIRTTISLEDKSSVVKGTLQSELHVVITWSFPLLENRYLYLFSHHRAHHRAALRLFLHYELLTVRFFSVSLPLIGVDQRHCNLKVIDLADLQLLQSTSQTCCVIAELC